METLREFDVALFSALNGCHNAYFDNFMWLVAGKFAWLLMIVALLLTLRDKGWRTALLTVLAVAVVIAIADQVSSGIIKPIVERLRPSHNPDLAATIHVVNGYHGGLYGFVSSHAANAFASAVLLAMVVGRRHTALALVGWAAVVSYSRVYEGVHYPGDVVCGALVGVAAALVAAWAYRQACRKWLAGRHTAVTPADAKLLTISIVANLLILAIVAFFN